MNRDGLALVFEIGDFVSNGQKQLEQRPVDPRAIVDAHLHGAGEIFPDAAGEQQGARRDLAKVGLHRFLTFREIDRRAGDEMPGHAQTLLGDPCQRAKRHIVISGVRRREVDDVAIAIK